MNSQIKHVNRWLKCPNCGKIVLFGDITDGTWILTDEKKKKAVLKE